MRLTFKTKSLIIASFITFSVIGAVGIETYLDYRDTEARAYKAASDVNLVVESQLRDTLKSSQHMLSHLSESVSEKGLAVLQNEELLNELKADCQAVIGCEAVGLIIPNGDMVLNTSSPKTMINVSDREYFTKAIETKNLYIGPAVVSRLPNKPIVFNLSKPIFDNEGNIIAVVTIATKTSHLTGFYSLLGFGFSPTVSVFKLNGDIISRNPDMDKYVGKNNAKSEIFSKMNDASTGTFLSISPLDGKKRLAAYKLLPDLEMVIFAGVEEEVAFKQWKIRAFRISSIIGFLLLLTLLTFFFACRALLQKEMLQIKNEKLDELSNVDDLTAIGNRRIFENTLKQEWSRHKRNKFDLAVLLIDVDFFKPYNDNYGHQEGDKALFMVAQALKECVLRPTDLIARYGGEEFVAVLNANEQGALLVAEKIRQKVEALAIKHDFSLIAKHITVSIGITSTDFTSAKEPEELVREADIALYKAKKSGRNRIEVFRTFDKK